MRLAVNLPEARPDGKVKKGHNKIPSPPSSSEHGQFADAAVALAAWCGAMFNATDEMTLDAASNTHCTGNRDDLTTQKQQPMIAWTSLTTQLSHVKPRHQLELVPAANNGERCCATSHRICSLEWSWCAWRVGLRR